MPIAHQGRHQGSSLKTKSYEHDSKISWTLPPPGDVIFALTEFEINTTNTRVSPPGGLHFQHKGVNRSMGLRSPHQSINQPAPDAGFLLEWDYYLRTDGPTGSKGQ